jgi:hypothetical protein
MLAMVQNGCILVWLQDAIAARSAECWAMGADSDILAFAPSIGASFNTR